MMHTCTQYRMKHRRRTVINLFRFNFTHVTLPLTLVWSLLLNTFAVLTRGWPPLVTPLFPAGLPVLAARVTVESERSFGFC